MVNNQTVGSNKKIVIISGAILLSVIYYFVYSFSLKDLDKKSDELFTGHQKNIELWVKTTTETAARWLKSMDENAQGISSSELFRLFAQEMLELDESSMRSVQDSSTPSENIIGDLSHLVEQMPLMRSVLSDYVQFNNLISARIAGPDGSTIIASISSAPALTNTQKELITATIINNAFTIAPIIKTDKGLIAEYAVPLSAVVSEDAHPVAVLFIRAQVTNSINSVLAGTPLPNSNYIPFFIQESYDNHAIISSITSLSFPISNHAFDVAQIPFSKMQSVRYSHNVYIHATQVPGYPFWVSLEIPETVLLSEVSTLAKRIYALAIAICIGITLLAALLWWVAVGKEQKAIAHRFRNLYHIIKQQKSLLDGVNSSLQIGLALIDRSGSILLSNNAFEKICGLKNNAEIDSITKVFDADVATKILLKVQSLAKVQEEKTFEVEIEDATDQLLFRITLYAYSDNETLEISGAVCIFQDITEFRRKRIEMQSRQRRVIEGLLSVVESIDPYLSGHSALLQKLAVNIAARMNSTENDITIIDTAAYFSQIGKFYIPRDILLKTGKLTEEESIIMRETPVHAFAILQNMDFGMPIASVVHEMYENMDGSGYPQGLMGNKISIYARILAVANIFLALTSPRSHRQAFDPAEAIEHIAKMHEKYDDKVVAALLSIVHGENVVEDFKDKTSR